MRPTRRDYPSACSRIDRSRIRFEEKKKVGFTAESSSVKIGRENREWVIARGMKILREKREPCRPTPVEFITYGSQDRGISSLLLFFYADL